MRRDLTSTLFPPKIIAVERLFADFFLNAKCLQRRLTEPQPEKWGAKERDLHQAFVAEKENVHNALLDSFNTPVAYVLCRTPYRTR